MEPDGTTPETPVVVDAPAAPASPVPVEAPAAPHTAPLTATTGESADLGQLAGIAEVFGDNPWMPLVVVVLAVVAVLGGRQGWKFWSERSERQHALEMKRLEIDAQKAGLGSAQPPPCQVRDAEHEARMGKVEERLSDLDNRLGGIEKRLSLFAGMDPEQIEDLDKRLKKTERAIVALKKED